MDPNDRPFFGWVSELQQPYVPGLLPMRWHPAAFSELFGVPTHKSNKKVGHRYKDTLIRMDVFDELTNSPFEFLLLSNEQELRDRHPDMEDYYERHPIGEGPIKRTDTHIGFADLMTYFSKHDLDLLFDIDNPSRFVKLLELMHYNSYQPVLQDIIHKARVYRREYVHILSNPNTPRTLLEKVFTSKFSITDICKEAGIYDIYTYLG